MLKKYEEKRSWAIIGVEVRKMVSRRYELTDEQWDRIRQYFEVEKKNGRPYKNVRNTVNGIVWILKSGAA